MNKMNKIFVCVMLLAFSSTWFISAEDAILQYLKVTMLGPSSGAGPQFIIDDPSEIAHIQAMFTAKSADGKKVASEYAPRSGYAGLLIENIGAIKNLPESFIIYRDNIYLLPSAKNNSGRAVGESGIQSIADKNRDFEKSIIKYGISTNKLSDGFINMTK